VNAFFDSDQSSYVGRAFYCDEANDKIAEIHMKEFLNKYYDQLKNAQLSFQFQFTNLGHNYEIALLSKTFDPANRTIIPDDEDYILISRHLFSILKYWH
jgi:hypothetical protein